MDEKSLHEPQRPGRRVLVVEDNRDSAETLGLMLEMWGHEVRAAHDGPSALETALGFRPDVVLLDIGLPGMDGYEVARRLRGQSELEGLFLVAMTGYGQDEDRQRTQAFGFDHHLVKPVEPRVLERLLSAGL
jgi:two-component system CheB/CheR fusion protein